MTMIFTDCLKRHLIFYDCRVCNLINIGAPVCVQWERITYAKNVYVANHTHSSKGENVKC